MIAITGADVMRPDGSFARRDLTLDGDRIVALDAVPDAETTIDARGSWVVPGIVDCHVHLAWSDFHERDRRRRTASERATQQRTALLSTLRAGVTSARDAGGADPAMQHVAEHGGLGPRLQLSVDMLGAADGGSPERMARSVDATLDRGAQWVKRVATSGVAGPSDDVLAPLLTREEIRAAVRTGAARGARTMVHTWGGASADSAIAEGAASLEHGVHLTREQVGAAAAAGMTLVPTLTIYRLVLDAVRSGELAAVPPDRIERVVEAHAGVVAFAVEEGLPIALGSDFGSAEQHGGNLAEIAALMDAGLSARQALISATAAGARLLGDADGGVIAPGRRADLVLLSRDPALPSTFRTAEAVVAVIKDGEVVVPG
jgi:imidazolonepropionase-like amidohydrolase